MLKCLFENNNAASLRHVCVHALVVRDNQILMVKRAAHLTNPHKYAFPGGFLDRDETTSQAALRELKEETGYDGEIEKLFAICDTPNRRGEDRQNVAFTYLIRAGAQTSQPDNESSEVVWLDLAQLPAADEFAFDHLEHIEWYQKYQAEPVGLVLPIMLSAR
jgi:8-oxo-dGTP diphosphatase